jgi:selT/selW/selH-like putative selenoprotein
LAAAIQKQLGADTELVASKGIFDVSVDGRLIFSKYEAGRFPEAGEVLAKVGGQP